jgi:hypothetical protein
MRWFARCESAASKPAKVRALALLRSPRHHRQKAYKRQSASAPTWLGRGGAAYASGGFLIMYARYLRRNCCQPVNITMVRSNGWGPRAVRFVGHVPLTHWRTLMFIRSVNGDRRDHDNQGSDERTNLPGVHRTMLFPSSSAGILWCSIVQAGNLGHDCTCRSLAHVPLACSSALSIRGSI